MQPQTFIFIGRSGSGKGTQVKKLRAFLEEQDSAHDVLSVETGARFRDFIAQNGYSNELSRKIYESGALQPSFLTVWLWSEVLLNKLTPDNHLIFDGTPRKLREAYVLDSALNFYDRSSRHIFHINVSREISRERMLNRGRSDDTEKDIQRRLDWFETDVAPILDMYKENDAYTFHDIDGEQSPDDAFQNMLERL